MTTNTDALPDGAGKKQNEKLVITASSLGTVFEWYDFYLYGLLASVISAKFFSGVNETTGFIQTTAMLGLLLASMFVVGLRTSLEAEAFLAWGWRLPFLFSIVLCWLRCGSVFNSTKAPCSSG